ncbi:LOW QUALITY PROTEIN: taste receptor type 1 member 1 [Rhynchonycteris naso]
MPAAGTGGARLSRDLVPPPLGRSRDPGAAGALCRQSWQRIDPRLLPRRPAGGGGGSGAVPLSCHSGYKLHNVCSELANMYPFCPRSPPLGTHHREPQGNPSHHSPPLAVIGLPTYHAAATAALLSPVLVPLVSGNPCSLPISPSDQLQGLQCNDRWEGAVPLSLCTIPGDKRQVEITVLLLQRFRQLARVFSKSVLLATLIAKVGTASENWVISTHISRVPGVRGTTSTVLGAAIPQRRGPGPQEFEKAYAWADNGAPRPCARDSWYSTTSSADCWAFRVQKMPMLERTLGALCLGLYAMAHGLHGLLGCCASGPCPIGVYPWQVLEQICKVNFLLCKDTVTFNNNGDHLGNFNIIVWDWSDPKWTFRVIISSTWSPVRLDINKTKTQGHGKDSQGMGCAMSVRSSDCLEGHQRAIVGFNHYCFKCVLWEAGTFLNNRKQGSGHFAAGQEREAASSSLKEPQRANSTQNLGTLPEPN